MNRFPVATVLNFVQFQLAWFALVLSAAAGKPWLGVLVTAVLVALHLRFFATSNEWQYLALIAVGGWLWECCVHSLGVLTYPNHAPELLFAPPWMAALWLIFAATINHSLAWLKAKVLLAALLGAIGGPLAFQAGEKLGAVVFVDGLWTPLFLAAAWAVLTPVVVTLSGRFQRAQIDVIGSVRESR